MIFLKKLFRRAAVSENQSGQMSIWLALGFSVFLALYLACLESVRKQSAGRQAEQAAESGLFSLFSEYEPHLLEEYGLFALDTSFRSGTENMDEICAHLWKFTELDTTDTEGKAQEGLALQGIAVKDPVRLTDGQGAVFYRQAVQVIKEQTGLSLAEDWMFDEAFRQKLEDDSQSFQEDCETYEGTVVDYEYDEDEEEPIREIQPGREYEVLGSAKLDDINEALGTHLESEDYDSVGGYIIEQLDCLPREGESVTLEDGMHLVVDELDKNRIELVHIWLPEHKDTEETPNA